MFAISVSIKTYWQKHKTALESLTRFMLEYHPCPVRDSVSHDDVIKWKHSPRNWPSVQGIPRTKASDASFYVFFDLRPNKRLSKQWWGWWFETPSNPLWRYCNISRVLISLLAQNGVCCLCVYHIQLSYIICHLKLIWKSWQTISGLISRITLQ